MIRPDVSTQIITFSGNLCRCTGYRPILEGYKTFTVVRRHPWRRFIFAITLLMTVCLCVFHQEGGCCGGRGQKNGCCMSNVNGAQNGSEEQINVSDLHSCC